MIIFLSIGFKQYFTNISNGFVANYQLMRPSFFGVHLIITVFCYDSIFTTTAAIAIIHFDIKKDLYVCNAKEKVSMILSFFATVCLPVYFWFSILLLLLLVYDL